VSGATIGEVIVGGMQWDGRAWRGCGGRGRGWRPCDDVAAGLISGIEELEPSLPLQIVQQQQVLKHADELAQEVVVLSPQVEVVLAQRGALPAARADVVAVRPRSDALCVKPVAAGQFLPTLAEYDFILANRAKQSFGDA